MTARTDDSGWRYFELRAAGGAVVFAAGEFSNGIWGFYRPGSEIP